MLSASHRMDHPQIFLCSGVTTIYISTGEIDQEAITENDITDPELMELIKEVIH